jgi:ubiquinone/menaquinone biosynthesis C-methylase UbiE
MERTLTLSEAKAFYDRLGARQDSQHFYEDIAIDELIRHSDFGSAAHVLEFGCGTGRVAERLLQHHLPDSATYIGVDASTTMTALAAKRLARFGSRALVRQATHAFDVARADRVVITYVLDLLATADIAAVLDESARVLDSGGRLCVASLTSGSGVIPRIVSALWKRVFRVSPRLVGGCRPIPLLPYLDDRTWRVLHHTVVSSFGISSEVVVAEKVM